MGKLFQEFKIKDMVLKNRIVMPPMCMYCAEDDGLVTQWHVIHYATRAVGGAGLLFVEATAICPEGRITGNDLGLWNDDQIEGMKQLVEAVHANGARIGVQLNHAGRKCTAPGMDVEAPSAIAFDENSVTPREMTSADIEETIEQFRQAAVRACKAGFDLIEVHAAHGYLLSEFLSPLTNKRTDQYGGEPVNRVRFVGEVIDAVRTVWPEEKPLCVRVSAEDYMEGGNKAEDLAEMLGMIKNKGIDFVDVSTGGVVSAAPKAKKGYQIPHAEVIRKETSLPVIAGGLVTEPQDADEIVTAGRADMIYIGRELLRNPYWPLHAAKELEAEISWPKQYERAK